jgi:kumamolisin
VFPLPAYQNNSNVPVSVSTNKKGRGVPDVAGDADPQTGYNVRVDGQNFVIGGTSAVAPLMAGLIALINQKKGANVGFIHPKLYAKPTVCRDITSGNNKTVTGNKGYTAGPGWDACSGNGVPDGVKLLNIL